MDAPRGCRPSEGDKQLWRADAEKKFSELLKNELSAASSLLGSSRGGLQKLS